MATYQAQHLYLTLHWEALSTGQWAPEKWQMGLRITHKSPLTDNTTARWQQQQLAGVVEDYGTETTTNFDYSYGFDGDSATIAGASAMYAKNYQKDIAEDCFTFATAMKANSSTLYRFVGVKMTPYNPSITTPTGAPKALTAPTLAVVKTPIAGNGIGTLAPQTAVAITLDTKARGKGATGRFYLGGVSSAAAGGGGEVNSSAVTQISTAVRAFLQNLNNASGIDPLYGPCVVVWHRPSTTNQVPGGTFSTVSGIRVGNMFDTQRRRRAQKPETYVDTAI